MSAAAPLARAVDEACMIVLAWSAGQSRSSDRVDEPSPGSPGRGAVLGPVRPFDGWGASEAVVAGFAVAGPDGAVRLTWDGLRAAVLLGGMSAEDVRRLLSDVFSRASMVGFAHLASVMVELLSIVSAVAAKE